MLETLIPAFLIGLAGSLHCIGMCGPIAMAMPLPGRSTGSQVLASVLYNLGRISTYAVFGLVFGLIGRSFTWFGWQQKMSIILGIAILFFLIIPRLFPGNSIHPLIQGLLFRLRNWIAKTLLKGTPASRFTTGMLNGLLPCGLVYLALTGAAITGESYKGMLFMVAFGTGTLPAMFTTVLMGNWLKQPLRLKLRKWYPAILVVMATLLILRGLNLGIPMVSPKLSVSASAAEHCEP